MKIYLYWDSIKVLRTIIGFHLAWLGLIGFFLLNLDIPFINEITILIGSIFSLGLIGLVILVVINANLKNITDTILYSCGLSIISLMVVGMCVNLIYPIFNIPNPLSIINSIIAINIFVGLLYIFIYHKRKTFGIKTELDVKFSYFYFILLLPFMSIFGTYLMNYSNDNILLIILLLIIALIPIFFTLINQVPPIFYPMTIFVVSISLLFQSSLISQYLIGTDIAAEYYISMMVKQSNFWDMAYAHNLNSVLSITILPIMLSNFLHLSIIWVFKALFIIIFAFIPVGLYQVYKEQMNEIDSFLAVFFVISIFTFYTEMIGLARQQIAEFFLVLIMMLALRYDYSPSVSNRILFLLFCFGIIISHYGLSAIFLICFLVALIMSYFIINKNSAILNSRSFILFFTVMISWYMYLSSASVFDSLTFVGKYIFESFHNIIGPNSTEALVFITRTELSPIHGIIKILTLIGQGFIGVGIISLLYKLKLKLAEIRFNYEYLTFSFVFAGLMGAVLIVPGFSDRINIYRMYHIALLFLAPFFVVGVKCFFGFLYRIKYSIFKSVNSHEYLYFARLFCGIFISIILLFNSGLISEISGDIPISISLNKSTYGLPFHTEQDELGAIWLSEHYKNSSTVWGSKGKGSQVLVQYLYPSVQRFEGNTEKLNGYVFLYHDETTNDRIIQTFSYNWSKPRELIKFEESNISKKIEIDGMKIYSNRESEIYSI